jgi:hypothetical protein
MTRCLFDSGQMYSMGWSRLTRMWIRSRVSALIALLSSRTFGIVEEGGGKTFRQ